jgi:hypothetical protein
MSLSPSSISDAEEPSSAQALTPRREAVAKVAITYSPFTYWLKSTPFCSQYWINPRCKQVIHSD